MTRLLRWLACLASALAASCGGGGDPAAPPPPAAASLLVALPGDDTRSAVELHASASWRVLREWPRGELHVFRRGAADAWVELAFAAGGRTLALQVLEGASALYVFGYDTEANLPSGRDPTRVREGIDVWRFDAASDAAQLHSHDVPLGGLDNLVYARESATAIDACALDRCWRLSPGAAPAPWDTPAMAGHELVDLRFEGAEAHAIVRPLDDHETGNAPPAGAAYAIARLRPDGATLQPLAAECVPFALRADNAAPAWSCASGAADHAAILRHDVARMPHRGLADFGLANTEGRIAWSQVYYLQALLHLDARHMPRLAAQHDWRAERAHLAEEIALAARQHAAGPHGYAARRYSLDRSPLLFALHLGRIALLLATAEQLGLGSADTAAALADLRLRLAQLQDTAEAPLTEIVAGTGYETLGYRRGIAFWADGANVPHNYVSGYTLGLLASATDAPAAAARAAALLRPLQEIEAIGGAESWHYWSGRGHDGWQAADAVSVNTPVYAGQRGDAHITYRTMDAMALLRLASVDASRVPPATVAHLRDLVSRGRLLPFANQELVRSGAPAALADRVARRYARSAAPWELQSQIWALEALAGR